MGSRVAHRPRRVSASAARVAALGVLGEVRRRDARARDLMRRSESLSRLDARDKGLAERLVLGVVATSGRLDAALGAYLARPGSLEPRVRDALRVSAFELMYLGTSGAVAVSQGVELVRGVAPRACGLANAVLRRVAEKDATLVAEARARVEDASADACDLALVAGWPEWLARDLACSLGVPACCEMAACALEPAPVWVSGNAALHPADEVPAMLRAAGLDPRPTRLAGTWVLPSAAGLAASGLVTSADVVVSDMAARLVARIASPAPASRVLEVGQGRATKTLLLEEAAIGQGGACDITGVDSVGYKSGVARDRLVHGLADHTRCLTLDARLLGDVDACEPVGIARDDAFDLVFVDAPCTGTGTMRRHPEIVWGLGRESSSELAELQLQILRAASARVRVSGSLVFSTCSVLDEENVSVVDSFLASDEGRAFALADVREAPLVEKDASVLELVSPHVDERGMFRSHPRAGSFDGHFCARFVRVG